MRTACFTTLTRPRLREARLLAETVRLAHPDWLIWAALAEDDGAWLTREDAASFDAVAAADEFAPAGAAPRGAAVVGAALRHLLDLGARSVVYFAPTIAVFHPLAELGEHYRDESVVLTPHRDGAEDMFDPSFLAVRADADGRAFAGWWAERLRALPQPAPRLPDHLGGVAIAVESGWNVAAWNVDERVLRFTAQGDLTANGERLCFCQFDLTRRPAQREARELWEWYAHRTRVGPG